MLLFNRKLSAVEACERGLVAEVFPDGVFQKEVKARIDAMAQLPVKVWNEIPLILTLMLLLANFAYTKRQKN